MIEEAKAAVDALSRWQQSVPCPQAFAAMTGAQRDELLLAASTVHLALVAALNTAYAATYELLLQRK